MSTTTKAKPKEVSITLIKPHTHKGEDHEAGATIKVAEHHVAWLQNQGVVAKPEVQ